MTSPLSFSQVQNTYLEISSDTYSKSQSDNRYLTPTTTEVFKIKHTSEDNRYLRISADHSSTIQCRFRAAQLQFRYFGTTTVSTNVVVFRLPNSATDDAIFGNGVSASAFNSSSDARLKDNVSDATVAEATNILDSVNVKTYNRNDRNNEARVGFIAQDLQAACTRNYAHCTHSWKSL